MYRNAKNVGYYMIGSGSLSQLGDLLGARRAAVKGPAVFFLDHFFEGKDLIAKLPVESKDMVLTDSQEIALICERAGVRHHWNKDLRFTSLDIVAEMRGLLAELAREYEHCLILRASCPLLTWVDVEDAWKRYSEAQADSLVTVKSMMVLSMWLAIWSCRSGSNTSIFSSKFNRRLRASRLAEPICA